MNRVIVMIASLAILACASVAPGQRSSTINSVSLGMTKQEAMSVMGAPSRVSADPSAEYLIYALVEEVDSTVLPPKEIKSDYFIKIVNGAVTAFGRVGEFGSEDLRHR